MNFDLSDEQEMVRETFARFFDETSTPQAIREAEAGDAVDRTLWRGLGELGAFSLRVPAEAGGLGLGTFDAAVVMEEAGRTLAPGPLAETILAARLIAMLGGDAHAQMLERVVTGETVASLAFHDIAERPVQFVAAGAAAELVVARRGSEILLLSNSGGTDKAEPNLASLALAELDLASLEARVIGSDAAATELFAATVEEWKLLIAAALAGLGRQALKLAAAYASEREQFGQPIGQFQGISHPLADCLCEVDGGRLLVWKAVRDIADGNPDAGANVSLAAWWNAGAASRAASQALQTFGGYGLTTEYDIYLHTLRAKAWPLVWGDPERWLEEAGRRFYGGERVSLPNVGQVSVDFDIGEEARAVMAEIDAFMAANVTPEMRERFHYSWEGFIPELHKKLAEANLLFVGIPELGGRKVGPYATSAARGAFEKHGYNNPAASVAEMVGLTIARAGSAELKEEVLSKIMAGDAIASLGYSEPGSGSDVFAAKTKATPDGNGWRIDGTKMFTSGADITDYVLMLTRTDPDVPKHKGLTMFIVPMSADGVTVQPVYTFQDERTNITFYDNVKVPDSWRLGEVNGGVRTMSVALELEHAGSFAGPMEFTVEAAEALARKIKAPGRGKLIDEPRARARLARAWANVEVSLLLEYRALWAAAEKKPNLAYGPMAKMFSSEKFLEDARDLLELTAPLSLTKRKGAAALVNQSYRHAHGTRIYGGTSEVHRSMIAERALGMPRTRA
ncbi:acyl-CoA dehydrogenase family protein [Sphingomonas tabacisoli]|uniref:Acyl-CoA dehydrogenase family protein n=1 Tax=Sphingomonas tabacisoli TaxID=2249466 RepID=A0ABW4I7J5_9SPHN